MCCMVSYYDCIKVRLECGKHLLQLGDGHLLEVDTSRANAMNFFVGVPDGVLEFISLEVLYSMDADAVPICDVANVETRSTAWDLVDPCLGFGVESSDVIDEGHIGFGHT